MNYKYMLYMFLIFLLFLMRNHVKNDKKTINSDISLWFLFAFSQ